VRRHLIAGVASAAIIAACASPGVPPGGPSVSAFPRVIATLPETSAVNARPGKVLIRYDDVIGEQSNGGELSKSVLISPWDGEPSVDWKRTGMTIRAKKGWRANTAYTITILPGIADFKGKASPFGYVMRFSTGPSIPKTTMRGVAFDWVQARPVPKATILAVDATDTTLVYLTVADSTGRYELGAVPPGRYMIVAIDEKQPNRTLEPREPWDTASVTLTDSTRADLYMFVHDTIAPRFSELRSNDSVTISLILDKPLKPGIDIPVANVRVVTSDSTVVPVLSIRTAEEERVEQARLDSLARLKDTTRVKPTDPNAAPKRTIDPTRRRDTVPTVPIPVAARKPPATELILKLGAALKLGTTYRVTVTGLRNLLGREGSASRLLILPKPTPIDTTKTPRPGTQRPGGPPGTVPPRDSTKGVPPVKPTAQPARPPR
jgi:hypothetical protein